MTQAYPLQWPHGQPRTKARSDSRFQVAHSQAFEEMMVELDRFGGRNVVVSTNIPLRRDGTPYRDGLTDLLDDPGVAVYFTKGKRQVAIGVDAYRRPWENCRALGLSIKAFRDIERYGAQQVLDQAFTGFTALPPPGGAGAASNHAWWLILGVQPDASPTEIRAAYKAKARAMGGTSVELNAARDTGLAARGAA
jgi:hypothetical protein